MPYLTAPLPRADMPGGVPYIVGNEAAERFSFYGMKGILVVFMTQYLMGSGGLLDTMSEPAAMSWYHLFTSAVYFTPLLGALLSDVWLGKYRTILLLSVVYCLGHLALAMDETRLGLALGLGLIAFGSGGIKPCVSAHVGDQFGSRNSHLLEKVFGWFYFAINLGSFVSTLLTPWLLDRYGPAWAFGVPGALMAIATWVFWLGRKKFVHIPAGGRAFLKETFSREGLAALGRLLLLYVFVAVFWSLYDQTGSAWVLQAQRMDRHFLGIEWLSSQIQAVNPILILLFIPVFGRWVYPFAGRFTTLTPLRKIGAGFFLTAASFWLSGWIEAQLQAGLALNIGWQLASYVLITAGEVLVSITCLEYSYTQAPRTMKSVIMAFYLISVSMGNLFVSLLNVFIQNEDGSSKLAGASYYFFFAALMLGAALLYAVVSRFFRERTYIQADLDEAAAPAAEA